MELRFDFAEDDSSTGFRLKNFEFYNWGTYHNTINSLDLNKTNALLTGDIGSGKSTIVDALTTLLIPQQKIIYNKAAGAGSKERSLRSYILGEYKSSKDDNYSSSKAVSLRDENSFSVLLGRFENDGFDESVTLAQFYYIVNSKEHKFFVVSKGDLSIKKDFFDFKDAKSLKKRLKATPHTNVYDTFKEYTKDFSRLMGLKSEQALNLFYQTVSLKEIGNLTSFIRLHMLEKGDIAQKVDELCKNFSDLNHAHESVLRAKEQIELLSPIAKDATRYEKESALKNEIEATRDVLSEYFAKKEIVLIETKLQELSIEEKKSNSNKEKIDKELHELRAKDIELKIELEKNGGNRLNVIESEIQRYTNEVTGKKKINKTYNDLAKSLDLAVVSNEHRFLKNMYETESKVIDIDDNLAKVQNEKVRNLSSSQKYSTALDELEVEILYLENNRSNIPQKIAKIRDAIAKDLDIDREELPFVGELVQVVDEEWEGAIERVLHSFALSLLVKDEYYDAVSSYVDSTNLRGKLVYLKMMKNIKREQYVDILPTSLLRKIEIKADSYLFEPLQMMLNDRFNIPCVESMDEFRRFKKALTKQGQFKSSLSRHEKDDRFSIDDRSQWLLGWDNLSKLKALQTQEKELKEKIEFLENKIKELQVDEEKFGKLRDDLRELLWYKDFSQLDWYSLSHKIESLEEEKIRLQESSDVIQTLQDEIEKLEKNIIDKSLEAEKIYKKIGAIEGQIEDRKHRKDTLNTQSKEENFLLEYENILETLFSEKIEEKSNLVNLKAQERLLREELNKRVKSLNDSIKRVSERVLSSMNIFVNKFPVMAKDFDASLSSLEDFKRKLSELKKDDLPRWEKRFNELFKEGTLRNILLIQEELEYQSRAIKDKIAKINDSLSDVEYNDGTYVDLIAESGIDIDIREFRQSLKSATSGAIESDNSYDEQKFLQIKKIIDRFNGREHYIDIDKKWTLKVTDVRNWFNFAASERYFSDKSEKEYYAHSGGKSGGQKEKLAYTVLASSLAFQFGVQHNQIQSRSFRFVMIDEAFGKGSDESTKYALKLFDKLKLQLLVITPKTKINVIEPFVKSVHFVANSDGMNSSLLGMSIEEYQKNKK